MKCFITISFTLILLFSANLFAKDSAETPVDPSYFKHIQQIEKDTEKHLNQLIENAEHIIGIEFIAAGSGSEHIYSRMGHALLRFVDDDGIFINDKVLSFVALVDGPVQMKRGIVGDYPVYPQIDSLGKFWEQYVRQENRPLVRYIIPTDKTMRRQIIDTLKNWKQNKSKTGQYTFFSRNCAGVLTEFLSASGLSADTSKGLSGRIPIMMDKWLRLRLLNPYKELTVHSPLPIYEKALKALDIKRGEFIEYKKWPGDAIERLAKNLKPEELLYLYQELVFLPNSISKQMLKYANYRKDNISYADVVGFASVPSLLYQTCLDQMCAEKISEFELQIWNEEDIKKMREARSRTFLYHFFSRGAVDPNELYPIRKRDNLALHEEHLLSLLNYETKCQRDQLLESPFNCIELMREE